MFYFRKIERVGILCLMTLLIVLLLAPEIYQRIQPQTKLHIQQIALLDSINFESKKSLSKPSKSKSPHKKKSPNQTTIVRKIPNENFDPNLIPTKEWIALGFPKYIGERIEKFRSKGGQFYKGTDLLKIYGIDSSLVNQLLPFIEIKQPSKNILTKVKKAKNPTKPVELEINQATALELQELDGIGPTFSERIIKYRKLLGGFTHINQLKEIYGLADSTIQLIESSCHVDTTQALKKIDLNQADFRTLIRHPYLNKKQVNVLLRYRKEHGDFGNINALKKVVAIDDTTVEKLMPYLKIETKR